jgi:hypothetical protein
MTLRRLDLLYVWERDSGVMLTPRSKLKFGEQFQADIRGIPEGKDYLLVSLFYEIDESGRISNRSFSINTSLTKGPFIDELKGLLDNYWLYPMESLPGLNYRIMGLLSFHIGIKEWKFPDY